MPMSQWVADYMASRSRERIERDYDGRCAQLAQAGAPRFFRILADQVKCDVADFHELGGDRRLTYSFVPSNTFVVRRPQYPAVRLTVKLNHVFIEYEFVYRNAFGSAETPSEGHFRIESDLHGRLQAMQDEVPFVEPSEISQNLLKLVFDRI